MNLREQSDPGQYCLQIQVTKVHKQLRHKTTISVNGGNWVNKVPSLIRINYLFEQ